MGIVYESWAIKLQHQSIAAINYGIAASTDGEHPPSLGEFAAHCRAFKPALTELRIVRKWSPEEIENNQKKIAEILAGLKNKVAL